MSFIVKVKVTRIDHQDKETTILKYDDQAEDFDKAVGIVRNLLETALANSTNNVTIEFSSPCLFRVQ